ncbi:hypothetical protein [Quadrisphaera granulorum]|uniref:hypothetical protein n=1 Tax=Quadrisphaera granulorum TaxID=317664 RepID=UPI001475B700|nr:hypothetical protein [Quadrisphaera granulorum]
MPDIRDLLCAASNVQPVEADPASAVLRRRSIAPRPLLGTRRRTVVVVSAGLVAVAAGTALVLAAVNALPGTDRSVSTPAVAPSEPPALSDDPHDWPEGLVCTLIGNAEGVSVDLTLALPLEGGDYYATVSVPSLGASATTGFAGNDGYGLGGGTEANLTSTPVEVDVSVATERGDVVYQRSVVATPQLHQPNGAACDGENYAIRLVADRDGDLRQLDNNARWQPPRDEQGRTSDIVWTACGVRWLTLSQPDGTGVDYERVGGVLDDGAGGPPPGWNTPAQRGWVSVDGDVATFQDERGHTERFQRVPADEFPQPCG